MVADKPDVKVSLIIERMQSKFGYTVSYRKAWKAKQLAIAVTFGNWEASYSSLPGLLAAVQHFMPEPNEPNKCGLCRQIGHNRSNCPQTLASRQ